MAFDVASVKPSNGPYVPSNFPLDPSDDYGATNGRLTADARLPEYIEFAYKVWGNPVQSREFSHLPKWVNTDRYTIEARAPTGNGRPGRSHYDPPQTQSRYPDRNPAARRTNSKTPRIAPR